MKVLAPTWTQPFLTPLGQGGIASLRTGEGGISSPHLDFAGLGRGEVSFLRCLAEVEQLLFKCFLSCYAALLLVLWLKRAT